VVSIELEGEVLPISSTYILGLPDDVVIIELYYICNV